MSRAGGIDWPTEAQIEIRGWMPRSGKSMTAARAATGTQRSPERFKIEAAA